MVLAKWKNYGLISLICRKVKELKEQSIEIFLKITVTSKTTPLDELSEHFGCKPSSKIKKDELYKGKSAHKKHGWSLWSTSSEISDLNIHWNEIYSQLSPTPDLPSFLLGKSAILDICGYFYTDKPFLGFSNDSLKEISNLGLEMGWDIYDLRE